MLPVIHSYHFIPRISEQAAVGFIDECIIARDIDFEVAFLDAGEDRSIFLFTLLELFLSFMSFVNIYAYAEKIIHFAVVFENRAPVPLHENFLAVLGENTVFVKR